ncbi:hypothetical protein AALA21_05280 [Eggerthellaceae bacterium 3-80]|nr:hypothetical protein D7W09_05060 [bacterium D16-34]
MSRSDKAVRLCERWEQKEHILPETVSLPLSTLAKYVEHALVDTNLSSYEIVKPVYSLHSKLAEVGVLNNAGFVALPTKLANRAAIECVEAIGAPSYFCLVVEFPAIVFVECLRDELAGYKEVIPEEKRTFTKLLGILDEALAIL